MNEAWAQQDDIEQLLRDHLTRQAARIDTSILRERIGSTLAAEQPPGRPVSSVPTPVSQRRHRWLRWLGAFSVAACLLAVGLIYWRSEEPLRASPQALLQETQRTFHQPVYRCYQVEVQRETDPDDINPMVARAKQTRLWTRGDRFWIETTFPNMPNRRHFWGRDEQFTLWMTFGPAEGILLTPAETPRWLSVSADVCSMQPDLLITEFLRDFDLRREETPGSPVHTIMADLKPGRWHPALKSAILELDGETKVLRRVVLHRTTINGVNLTTTFTLIETKSQNEIQYPLDGKEGQREFYTADYKPEKQKALLAQLCDKRAAEWARPLIKK
jgi:hypothetical protein